MKAHTLSNVTLCIQIFTRVLAELSHNIIKKEPIDATIGFMEKIVDILRTLLFGKRSYTEASYVAETMFKILRENFKKKTNNGTFSKRYILNIS